MLTTVIIYDAFPIILAIIIDNNKFLDTSTINKLSGTSKEMNNILVNLPTQICLRKSFIDDNAILDSLINATIKYRIVVDK